MWSALRCSFTISPFSRCWKQHERLVLISEAHGQGKRKESRGSSLLELRPLCPNLGTKWQKGVKGMTVTSNKTIKGKKENLSSA
jgi:hypothetical protein